MHLTCHPQNGWLQELAVYCIILRHTINGLLQASCDSIYMRSHDGLQNGFSFLGNISSILQQQEQAIAAALVPRTPSADHTRGLKQVLTLLRFCLSVPQLGLFPPPTV